MIDPDISFWRHVAKGDGCWEWTGGRLRDGYGQFWNGDRMVLAHRVSWTLAHGPIPKGLCVLHRCDNSPCVRPDHLWLGTIGDNNRDCAAKGRTARGATHGQARLTEADARQIRSSPDIGADLARRYGVSSDLVSKIRRGIRWRHLLAEVEA